MKKQVKIIAGLMLCAALIMTLVGCGDPTAASGGSGNTDGATNAFAGKTYGVRIDGGARYYGFTTDVLTITEETTKVANQNRMQSGIAQQTEKEYFIPYKGPYTAEGDTVSYEAMNGDPVEASFDFKDDGSFSVETKVNEIVTESAVASTENVEVEVIVPVLPDTMVTKDDLVGIWLVSTTFDGETMEQYMEFTEDDIISYFIVADTIIDTYKSPYIAQFGKNEADKLDPNVVKLRLAVDDDELEANQKPFDAFLIFNATKDSFTMTDTYTSIDGSSDTTITLTFTKISESELPAVSTFKATQSDLYGSWKTTIENVESYVDKNTLVATITQEQIYTFSADTVKVQSKVIKSNYTGTSHSWLKVGYIYNSTEDIISYEVNSARIIVKTQGPGDYRPEYDFMFINQDTAYRWGNEFIKQ